MQDEARPLPRKRVLLAEDEYFIADDVLGELNEHGMEMAGPCPTVRDALARLEQDRAIDAAIVDINLRGELAFPVAEALVARGLPFLFMTGYDRGIIPGQYGAVIRCEKPIMRGVLARALLRLLNGA